MPPRRAIAGISYHVGAGGNGLHHAGPQPGACPNRPGQGLETRIVESGGSRLREYPQRRKDSAG